MRQMPRWILQEEYYPQRMREVLAETSVLHKMTITILAGAALQTPELQET